MKLQRPKKMQSNVVDTQYINRIERLVNDGS